MVDEEQLVEKGQRWRYDGTSPHTISTRRYGPMWLYITVEWVDGENVHYRRDHTPNKIDQTTLARFLEIAELVPKERILDNKLTDSSQGFKKGELIVLPGIAASNSRRVDPLSLITKVGDAYFIPMECSVEDCEKIMKNISDLIQNKKDKL